MNLLEFQGPKPRHRHLLQISYQVVGPKMGSVSAGQEGWEIGKQLQG